jgi:hypothetical protein
VQWADEEIMAMPSASRSRSDENPSRQPGRKGMGCALEPRHRVLSGMLQECTGPDEPDLGLLCLQRMGFRRAVRGLPLDMAKHDSVNIDVDAASQPFIKIG